MAQDKFIETPKGTILPLDDLKGKPYLKPAYRLVWFREEHPDWPILSTVSMFRDDHSVKAEVTIKNEHGVEMARACSVYTFEENAAEGAETGAMGRALAFLGYGTQFSEEKENVKRPVVDSPVYQKKSAHTTPSVIPKTIARDEIPEDHRRPIEVKPSKNHAPTKESIEKLKVAEPRPPSGPTSVTFKQANELKTLGMSNHWTMNRMMDKIKEVTKKDKFMDLNNEEYEKMSELFAEPPVVTVP